MKESDVTEFAQALIQVKRDFALLPDLWQYHGQRALRHRLHPSRDSKTSPMVEDARCHVHGAMNIMALPCPSWGLITHEGNGAIRFEYSFTPASFAGDGD